MTAAEELRTCADATEQACSALSQGSPTSLEACSDILEAAAVRMGELRPALEVARGDAETLAEAWRLRRTIRAAGLLLENAAEYHVQWRKRWGVQQAGYGPGGAPPEVASAGRIWLRG
jgi:hypothetical protein